MKKLSKMQFTEQNMEIMKERLGNVNGRISLNMLSVFTCLLNFRRKKNECGRGNIWEIMAIIF